LILDEPFAGLDPFNVELFKNEIAEMADKGSMIIFSSHRMEHVELFCKKLVILLKGKSVISGYLKDIKEHYRKKNIFIKADITKKALSSVDGVLAVIEKADEFEVKIADNSKVDDVFKAISNSKNVSKFVVEEPSLNEIFISEVGDKFEK